MSVELDSWPQGHLPFSPRLPLPGLRLGPAAVSPAGPAWEGQKRSCQSQWRASRKRWGHVTASEVGTRYGERGGDFSGSFRSHREA